MLIFATLSSDWNNLFWDCVILAASACPWA